MPEGERDAGRAPRRAGRRDVLLLLLASVLPYLNGLAGDFTYDDKVIVRDNPRLASPSTVGEILTTHYFGGGAETATNYRPAVLLTYAVQRWVHGNRPLPFHAVNVALHAAVTLLLFRWLLLLGFPRLPVLAASVLFAVLPIHVEAVTSIVGRGETLAALCVLASAFLWLRATGDGALRPVPYLLSLSAFTLGVFVKESAAVVPGVVLLGELFRGGSGDAPLHRLRRLLERRAGALAGLLAPLAVLFGVRRLVLGGFLTSGRAAIFDLENPLVSLEAPLRVVNAIGLLFRYAFLTFVPVGLSADHSARSLVLAGGLLSPRAILPVLLAAALATLAVRLWRARPLVAFGLCLFAGTFLPASNVPFPIGTVWGERLAYLPSAGLLLAFAGLLAPRARAVPRPSRVRWREAAVGLLAAGYAVGTAVRNRVWLDDAALFADTVAKAPRSAKARYNLAYHLWREKDAAGAVRELRTATEIFPRHYTAWSLLGRVARDEGRYADAVEAYAACLKVHSRYEGGLWGYAASLEDAGRRAESEAAWARASRVLPASSLIAQGRAGFFDRNSSPDRRLHEWRRAVITGLGAAPARLGLARALLSGGERQAAVEEARWALFASPGLSEARVFLAERYEEEGRGLAAAAELGRAWRSRPFDADLAARLLELGARREEARSRAEAAVPSITARFGARPADPRLAAALAVLSR